MRNRIIALLIIGFVVFGSGYYFLVASAKRSLTVTIPVDRAGYMVGVYRAGNDDTAAPATFMTDKNLIKEFGVTTKLHLKQGNYVVANKKSDDYAQQIERVYVTDKPLEVQMKAAYSDEKLAGLLANDKAAIQSAVTTALPTAKNYEFATEKLYQNGDWYGAVLTVKLTTEQARVNYVDKYHLVAHKENGKWSLLTNPELVLSKQVYPDIPVDILREVNKL